MLYIFEPKNLLKSDYCFPVYDSSWALEMKKELGELGKLWEGRSQIEQKLGREIRKCSLTGRNERICSLDEF